MLKQGIVYFTIFALLHSQTVQAEDPPANPFSNLPNQPQTNFNPFDVEDDFDQAAEFGMDSAEPTPARDTNTGGGRGAPIVSGNAPTNSGSSRASGTSGNRKQTLGKDEPANFNDVVENFDYPDANILDVAKAIAKLTGKNFIYSSDDIKSKKISIVSKTPITVRDAWNAFSTALNIAQFALIPAGKYYRIERLGGTKERQTAIVTGRNSKVATEEIVTRILPLKYIDATQAEQAFRYWVPREGRLQAYTETNTLIITDTASHIEYLVKLIGLLDVAGYQESIVVVQVRHAPAKDIAKLIQDIISERNTGSSFGGAPRPAPTPTNTGTRTRGRQGGSVISKIIADDRTNSLILKANATGIQEVRNLLRQLDVKAAINEGSGRIHVINLQFAAAEDIAKTLTSVTAGATNQRANNRSSFPTFGDTASVFRGDIKITADKTTQSLVVMASPQDFVTIKKVVERLDVPRDQVFIEALIMEMSANRDNKFGTSFVSASNGIALPSSSLTSLLSGNPIPNGFVLGFKHGAQKAGVTVGTGESAKTFRPNSLNGLIELIQGNTDSNIIATPQIIALDNEQANFEINETSYIPKSSTTQGVVTQSFDEQKAEVSLKVTPQINKASNFVKLKINQKVEDFNDLNIPTALQGQVKGKNVRLTDTSVIVQNEDTVVLSGMMRDVLQENVRKVPILGDIPILGWLFKNSEKNVRKTNLLVFITPRIIKQYDSMRKILDNRLKKRETFIKDLYGTIDPQSKEIQEIKDGLPDLHVFEPLPQQRPLSTSSFPLPEAPEKEDGGGFPGLDPMQLSPGEGNFAPEFTPPENSPPPAVEPLDL